MSDLLFDPILWLFLVIPGCAIVNLIAAVWLRSARREMLSIACLLLDKGSTKEDRAWIRYEVNRSKGTDLLIASPFAPFAILGALALGVHEGWRGAGKDYDQRVSEVQRDIDLVHRKVVELAESIDLSRSQLWDTDNGRRLRILANHLEEWNNPVAMLWILAWVVVASPLLAVAYFTAGSIKPFVVNLWAPLRDPITSILNNSRMFGNVLFHR